MTWRAAPTYYNGPITWETAPRSAPFFISRHGVDRIPVIKRTWDIWGKDMPNMHKLEVRESRIHGKGVYAVEPISKGSKIGTYHGEITEEDDTYVLWITDEDGTEYGVNGHTDLKFLNHSREPNAEFDGDELHALVDVAPGEEITFHYGEGFVEWLDQMAESVA